MSRVAITHRPARHTRARGGVKNIIGSQNINLLMLGLFKKTKIADWEIRLLKNTIRLLPPTYKYLESQIDDGLLKGVLIGVSDLPGYVAFTYNPGSAEKFEREKEKGYTLTCIKVYDKRSQTYLNYSIHVSTGTINGYSITGATKFIIESDKIDVSNFKKVYRANADYKKIESYLSIQEREIINPDEVYEVILNGKAYFHIKELQDGDFIGIDYEKNVYEIRHDPFEIKLLDSNLFQILG